MRHQLLGKVTVFFILAGAAGVAQAGASCLLFPLSCLAPSHKYGDEVDATVLAIDEKFTEVYVRTYYDYGSTVTPRPLDNTREFYVSFQVGQTRYVAWIKDTVVQMAGLLGGYKPKREKWINKTIKMRFMDEHWMGLKTPVAVFKTPEGKDWKLVIVSIVGPDGVEECPPFWGLSMNDGHCAPQTDVDRAKREKDALAKLEAQGRKPVWQSAEGAALAESVRAKGAQAEAAAATAVAATPAAVASPAAASPEASAAEAGSPAVPAVPVETAPAAIQSTAPAEGAPATAATVH